MVTYVYAVSAPEGYSRRLFRGNIFAAGPCRLPGSLTEKSFADNIRRPDVSKLLRNDCAAQIEGIITQFAAFRFGK